MYIQDAAASELVTVPCVSPTPRAHGEVAQSHTIQGGLEGLVAQHTAVQAGGKHEDEQDCSWAWSMHLQEGHHIVHLSTNILSVPRFSFNFGKDFVTHFKAIRTSLQHLLGAASLQVELLGSHGRS